MRGVVNILIDAHLGSDPLSSFFKTRTICLFSNRSSNDPSSQEKQNPLRGLWESVRDYENVRICLKQLTPMGSMIDSESGR